MEIKDYMIISHDLIDVKVELTNNGMFSIGWLDCEQMVYLQPDNPMLRLFCE